MLARRGRLTRHAAPPHAPCQHLTEELARIKAKMLEPGSQDDKEELTRQVEAATTKLQSLLRLVDSSGEPTPCDTRSDAAEQEPMDVFKEHR